MTVVTLQDSGETTIAVTQRLWDRYIAPIYDGSSGEYYLMDADSARIIKMQGTGDVLWKADSDRSSGTQYEYNY